MTCDAQLSLVTSQNCSVSWGKTFDIPGAEALFSGIARASEELDKACRAHSSKVRAGEKMFCTYLCAFYMHAAMVRFGPMQSVNMMTHVCTVQLAAAR